MDNPSVGGTFLRTSARRMGIATEAAFAGRAPVRWTVKYLSNFADRGPGAESSDLRRHRQHDRRHGFGPPPDHPLGLSRSGAPRPRGCRLLRVPEVPRLRRASADAPGVASGGLRIPPGTSRGDRPVPRRGRAARRAEGGLRGASRHIPGPDRGSRDPCVAPSSIDPARWTPSRAPGREASTADPVRPRGGGRSGAGLRVRHLGRTGHPAQPAVEPYLAGSTRGTAPRLVGDHRSAAVGGGSPRRPIRGDHRLDSPRRRSDAISGRRSSSRT